MRRHAKAPLAAPTESKAAGCRLIFAAAAVVLLASLALGVSLAGAVAPTVSIESASAVSNTTAKVKGTVDPGDHETSYHFEVATTADFSSVSGSAGFGSQPEGAGPQSVEGEFSELSPGTAYHLRLIAENVDGSSEAVAASTFTTLDLSPPAVSIDNASAITSTGAHLSGSINPQAPAGNPAAYDVDWSFQCTPSCPGLTGGTVPADSANHPVSADASGLVPNTEYLVKLTAVNEGTSASAAACFRTTPEGSEVPVGPAATSLPAAGVTETSAVVGGWVDPNGSAATHYVQYATQPDFSDAQSLPASQDAAAGSCKKQTAASLVATSLEPDTDYFFRVVAQNASGTDTSASQDFHTLAPEAPQSSCPNQQFRLGPAASLPECRAYERLTPQDKNGAEILEGDVFDSDHLWVGATGPFPGGEGTLFGGTDRIFASRSPSGWHLRGMTFGSQTGTTAINDSFSQEVIEGRATLTPDDADLEPAEDIWLRRDGAMLRISKGPLGGNAAAGANFAGQSADGSHVLFQTPERLLSVVPEDATGPQLYEHVDGQLRLVALDSAEQPIGKGGAVLGNGGFVESCKEAGSSDAVSSDGSVIFFSSPASRGSCEEDIELYARIDGEDTVHVSSSQCNRVLLDPPCAEDGQNVFQGAADDGSIVYFSTPAQLVDEDLDDFTDLYAYDLGEHRLERVVELEDGASCMSDQCGFTGMIGVSRDGQRASFLARGTVHGQGSPDTYSLLVYDRQQGSVQRASQIEAGRVSSDLGSGPTLAEMTPNGGFIVFETRLRLTAFDNHELAEVYRYDVDAEDLTCLSCNPTGSPPLQIINPTFQGRAAEIVQARSAGYASPGWTTRQTSVVSEDGSYVVFTAGDPLLARDTNGRADIYLWHDGRVSLLSTGTGSGEASLDGISPDGHDVFFNTSEQLVGGDTDGLADAYTARIGGGFASDFPSSNPPCGGDSCRGGGQLAAESSSPGTPVFVGPGNRKPSRCGKGRVRRGQRCVGKRRQRKPHGRHKHRNHRASDNRGTSR